MSAITTHVLDTSRGRPAADVDVVLEIRAGDGWKVLGSGRTDADGRLRTLLASDIELEPGEYRLTFATARYFAADDRPTLYPSIAIVFATEPGETHYHVPLLVAPFGYSTYRGS
jgi:5-hydroxyisourate hydrolase